MSALYASILRLLVRLRHIGPAPLCREDDTYYILEHPRASHRQLLTTYLQRQHRGPGTAHILSLDPAGEQALPTQLLELIRLQRNHPERPIRLQPVMILHGHLPRQRRLRRLLSAETWRPGGKAHHALQLLCSGRDTLLRADVPIRLDRFADDLGDMEAAQKVHRVLRTHFHRAREAMIGPDLSHRRTLIGQILGTQEVQCALKSEAERRQQPVMQVEHQALALLNHLSADFNPLTVQVLNRITTPLLRHIYQQIDLRGFDRLKQLSLTHQLVYLPCHRSHMDYLLLSWVLYQQGLTLPHIAAGENLNLPLIGPILRQGGAIFMRRSFHDDPFYYTLFRQYLRLMQHRGHALEYFIEGGRSRTGRLLNARTGLLGMTLDAWRNDSERPLALVPVSINYDRCLENRSYQRELSGRPKRRETLLGALASAHRLLKRSGGCYLSIGEPVVLNEAIASIPLPELGEQVLQRINQATVATPVAQIAYLLLSRVEPHMEHRQLVERLQHLDSLLGALQVPRPKGDPQPAAWLRDAIRRRQIRSSGELIMLTDGQAESLCFYRSTLLHALIVPGLLLLFASRLQHPGKSTITRLLRALLPYLNAEFHLPPVYGQSSALAELRHMLLQQKLLKEVKEKRHLHPVDSPLTVHLLRAAEPVLLRHYLLIRLLAQLGCVERSRLISAFTPLASHIQHWYGDPAPDYIDTRQLDQLLAGLEVGGLLKREGERLQATRDLSPLLRIGARVLPQVLIQEVENWLTDHLPSRPKPGRTH